MARFVVPSNDPARAMANEAPKSEQKTISELDKQNAFKDRSEYLREQRAKARDNDASS